MDRVFAEGLEELVQVSESAERTIGNALELYEFPPADALSKLEPHEDYGELERILTDLDTYILISPVLESKKELLNSVGKINSLYKEPDRKIRFSRGTPIFYTSPVIDLVNKYLGGYIYRLGLARDGLEGGLYQLIRDYMSKRSELRVAERVESAVREFWGTTETGEIETGLGEPSRKSKMFGTLEERSEHVKAYREKFRAFLPNEVQEMHKLLLLMKFEGFLRDHPRLIKRARGLIT